MRGLYQRPILGFYYLMEKRNKYMVAQAEGITDPAIIDTINLTKGCGRSDQQRFV